jgi:uncharacterized protein (DUF2267 family)
VSEDASRNASAAAAVRATTQILEKVRKRLRPQDSTRADTKIPIVTTASLMNTAQPWLYVAVASAAEHLDAILSHCSNDKNANRVKDSFIAFRCL